MRRTRTIAVIAALIAYSAQCSSQGTLVQFGLPGERITCLAAEVQNSPGWDPWPQGLYAGTEANGMFGIQPFDSLPSWLPLGFSGDGIAAMNVQRAGIGPGEFRFLYASVCSSPNCDSTAEYVSNVLFLGPGDTSWENIDTLLNKSTLKAVRGITSWYYFLPFPGIPGSAKRLFSREVLFSGIHGCEPFAISGGPLLTLDSISLNAIADRPWDSNEVWAAGAYNKRGVLCGSADAGTTWKMFTLPLSADSQAYSVSINQRNPDTVYAGTSTGAWRTTNRGTSWYPLPLNGFPVHAITVDPINPLLVYAGSRDTSGLFQSSDGGNSWARIVPVAGNAMAGISSIVVVYPASPDSTPSVFAGTQGTGVWRYRSSGINDVPAHGREVAASVRLFQNYPNPFNPNSEIRYQISEFRHVRLVVYDLLGREVATLVNEVKEPGAYTVQFDGSNLASGVYFYRLEAGGFMETKRLLLLK